MRTLSNSTMIWDHVLLNSYLKVPRSPSSPPRSYFLAARSSEPFRPPSRSLKASWITVNPTQTLSGHQADSLLDSRTHGDSAASGLDLTIHVLPVRRDILWRLAGTDVDTLGYSNFESILRGTSETGMIRGPRLSRSILPPTSPA